MTYTVQQLLHKLDTPIIADPKEPIRDALDRMIKHGYSQLPVVKTSDNGHQKYYLITDGSILGALSTFGVSTSDLSLKVEDAIVKIPKPYSVDDELFELFSGMKEYGIALIIDTEGKLINIVTNSDIAEYLRQWAEDILYVRDIEFSLKRYIREAHKLPTGEINEEKLQESINEIIPSTKEFRKKFEGALMKFLSKNSEFQGKKITLDKNEIDAAFTEIEKILDPPKQFSELTLDGYIKLFLHEQCWERCCSAFNNMDKKNVLAMMDGVRKTRNKLAHFREDEITALDRKQLKACADWLASHEKMAFQVFDTLHNEGGISN